MVVLSKISKKFCGETLKCVARINVGAFLPGYSNARMIVTNLVPQAGVGDTATTSIVDENKPILFSEKVSIPIDKLKDELTEIRDFMAKPLLISSYVWKKVAAGGPVANDIIATVPIGALLASNVLWARKTEGFKMARGDFHFRVMLNANPFQQGALRVHFLPCASTMQSGLLSIRNMNITTKSMQPGGIITCSDKAMDVVVPYVTPDFWYNLVTPTFDWGTVYITVFDPLQSGALETHDVDVSIYGWFENFELSAPMVPQSSGGSSKQYKAKILNESDIIAANRPLSSSLAMASKIAQNVSSIPILSSYAQPLSWFFSLSSGIASAFGYSKQPIENPTTSIARQAFRYSACSDGVDPAQPLGLHPDSGVKREVLTLTDEDEMSFAFLKRQSALITTLSWPETALPNDTIYTLKVLPSNLKNTHVYTSGAKTVTMHVGPPIFYLASEFLFWRGSICVNLQFIKTAFHTGRLDITWTPYESTVGTVPTTTTSQYALREIVDLSLTDNICLRLPCMPTSPYLTMAEASGTLVVKVINGIRSPESACQDINILVSVSGGDDFELQGPGAVSVKGPMVPQVDDGTTDTVDSVIGCTTITPYSTFASLSIGDSFNSVKQLLNRTNSLSFNGTRPLGVATTYEAVLFWPWFCGIGSMTAGTADCGIIGGDAYTIVAPMYAFYHGSARLSFNCTAAPGTNAQGDQQVVARNLPGLTGSIYAATSIATLGTSNYITTPSTNNTCCFTGTTLFDKGVGVYSVTVPPYSTKRGSLLVVATKAGDSNIPSDTSRHQSVVEFSGYQALLNNRWFRSFADDFTVSYYLGCPPRFVSSV